MYQPVWCVTLYEQDNKQEYVDLVIEYKTHRSMAGPLEALKQGFYDVIPWEAIRVFSVDGTPQWRAAHKCGICGSSPIGDGNRTGAAVERQA